MPEAVAVDPESISPNGGMATPFSPDLMFSGPGFGLAQRPWNQRPKIRSGLNGAARPRHGLILIPLTPGGSPLPLDSPLGPKGRKIVKNLGFSVILDITTGLCDLATGFEA